MAPRFELLRTREIAGFLFGFVQPSALAQLQWPAEGDFSRTGQQLRAVLSPHLPPERPEIHPANLNEDAATDLAFAITVAVAGIQEASGIPVAGVARVDWVIAKQDAFPQRRVLQLAMPSFAPRAGSMALRWVLDLLNELIDDTGRDELTVAQADSLKALIKSLTRWALPGTNNIRFVHAALQLGIPVLPLPGKVFQYGWGKRGRLFQSSITDETSSIAVSHCRDKSVTNARLRIAELPVPSGQLAVDQNKAVSISERLGFPVVVKPADLDQGVAVSANLRTAEEVRAAFQKAVSSSRNVLVEKHIPGEAFRITVFRGQSVAVVQRLPAAVTGDGRSTIEALVAETNKDPRRAPKPFSIMKPVVIDDEAITMLAELGMSVASVPEAGRFVALKRAANLSTGGDVVLLDLTHVHHGYLALAERATKILRLDVSGVDLVTSDIYKPPHEAGAAIIEVNAQPQMGSILTHIHAQLLKLYVQGSGTIPAAVVLGDGKEAIVQGVRERCAESGLHIGTVAADGLFVGGDRVAAHPGNELGAVSALLVDPEVTALLLATDGGGFVQYGIPLPFFDSLFLANWQGPAEDLARLLMLLKPHLRGAVMLEPTSPHWQLTMGIFGASRVRPVSSLPAMADAINQFLSTEQAP